MEQEKSAAAVAPGTTANVTANAAVRHLSQDELSQRWQVSTHTLERWRSGGLGPKFLKLGNQVRYPLSDVEAFETKSRRSSTSEAA